VLQPHPLLPLLPCRLCAVHLPLDGMQLRALHQQQVLLLHPAACLLPNRWQRPVQQDCLADQLHVKKRQEYKCGQ
jgi:hypothetical protein